MPSRPSPLWWLTGFVLIGYPVLNFIYWPVVLQAGVLPIDGDSIGIPIFESVLIAFIFSPLILGIAWLCLRRYNPDTRIWSWRRDRPFRSLTATILFGTASAFVTADIVNTISPPLPWYEYLWPAYFSVWLPWFLCLRAATIDRLDYKPTHPDL